MAPSSYLTPDEGIQHILQRYNSGQAHRLVYTYEELRALGIQPEFLISLLETFENPALFKPQNFSEFSLEIIVDYLRKTHSYYLNKKLPEIEQSILLLINSYPESHPLLLLLRNFYLDYKKHLSHHIEVEEMQLMPYILELERALDNNRSSISEFDMTVAQFIDQHHDTEKDLEEIRNTILHYSPPQENQTLYRILLSQLQVLEKDLAVHALIEDEVLLPRALELERKLN